MSIKAGQQLLHYRLIEQIGEGGMGLVWRAQDTDLGREVAIKLLPELFAKDTERLARFEREARLLASLNHPAIAAIYGLHRAELAPGADPVHFLAIELVEGEDLEALVKRGPVPVDDALKIARQVCEAFAAAHDSGIIHRDLKPANVMLNREGKVKVLDFGLAKALDDPAVAETSSAADSPTMTSAGTQMGVILGTAAYMSPEQARGKPVDRRADIWALGCLLFEMLTGKAAFGGETITDTLAAVVREEPAWETLPQGTPASVRRVLRRALEKDPARRIRDAADFRLELEETDEPLTSDAESMAHSGAPSSGAKRLRWVSVLWAVGGAALALLAAWLWLDSTSRPAGVAARFEVESAQEGSVALPLTLAVSPDGQSVAWVVLDGGMRSIYYRRLNSLEVEQLPDTEGAETVTFSPDSASIAFIAGLKIRRLDLGQRRAQDLCATQMGSGLAWGRDGNIIFDDGWLSPLYRVSAEGGVPEPLSKLDETYGEIGHWFPELAPGGKHVVVARWRLSLSGMSLASVSLETGKVRELLPRASYAKFSAPDQLLFSRAGVIYSVKLDPDTLEILEAPKIVLDQIDQEWGNGQSPWDVSQTGVLAYAPGGLWSTKRAVVRVSTDGVVERLDVEPDAIMHIALSPDGRRLAYTKFDNGEANVFIRDLERGVEVAVPSGSTNAHPVWNPNGEEIVYASATKGPWDLYRFKADGSMKPELLIESESDKIPLAWSPDGRHLVWNDNYTATVLLDFVDNETSVYRDRDSNGLAFSPDSKWVAFDQFVDGEPQIFVSPFPVRTRDYQVSIEGGGHPLWPTTNELLFRRGDIVLAAIVQFDEDSFDAARPRELFRGKYVSGISTRTHWSYDRQRGATVLIEQGDRELSQDRFVVVTDWPQILGPTKTEN